MRRSKTPHNPICKVRNVGSNFFKCAICHDGWQRYQAVLELLEKGDFEEGMSLAQEILKDIPHHQATDAENNAIVAVAEEFAVPLADVRAAIIAAEPNHVPGETLFTDHCHLNSVGYEILIDVYEEQILPLVRASMKS